MHYAQKHPSSMDPLPAAGLALERRMVLGISLWSRGLEELVSRSLRAVSEYQQCEASPFVFACANPHSLVVSETDEDFKRALLAADAVVADGVGLTIVARRLYGQATLPRITGSDYFGAMMRALDERAGRVAFLGSSPTVLQRLVARCAAAFPRVTVSTAISPPYGRWSAALDADYARQIREARPDVLWVGMTAPKQEKWVYENRDRLHAGVVGSIGAVFDYFAGTVRRAPEWLCRAGFEWAYRFAHEPARLWERNFVSGPRFIGLALRERASSIRGVVTTPQ